MLDTMHLQMVVLEGFLKLPLPSWRLALFLLVSRLVNTHRWSIALQSKPCSCTYDWKTFLSGGSGSFPWRRRTLLILLIIICLYNDQVMVTDSIWLSIFATRLYKFHSCSMWAGVLLKKDELHKVFIEFSNRKFKSSPRWPQFNNVVCSTVHLQHLSSVAFAILKTVLGIAGVVDLIFLTKHKSFSENTE